MLIKNTLFAILIIALNSQITAKNYLHDSSGNYSLNDSTKSIKILPLGNSITIQSRGDASYRYFLWYLLKDSGYNVDFIGSDYGVGGYRSDIYEFDQDHEGHGGIEANQVNDKLDSWLKKYTPDIVLLHLGHNDLFHGQSVSSTVDDIRNIINKLRGDNPDVAILLAKIIPVAWPAPQWGELNDAYEVLASEQNTTQSPVVIVDQNTNYDPYIDNKDDGTHPNLLGDEKMGKVWYNSLTKLLSGSFPASKPYPVNDSIKVNVNTNLNWVSDSNSISHNVYFGTSNPPSFKQNQLATNYNPGILSNSTTYYWRIDEVTETDTVRGHLWSFNTIYEDLPPEIASDFFPINKQEEIELAVMLKWKAGYKTETNDVYLGKTNPPPFKSNQSDTVYSLEILDINTIYYWRIDGKNAHGTTEGEILSFKTIENSLLPDEWYSAYIGNVGTPGVSKEQNGVFTLSGVGNDLNGNSDIFQYTFTSLSGNGEIIAKVVSLENTNPFASAGIMIRENINTDSKFFSLAVSAENGIIMRKREENGENAEQDIKDAVGAPYWIKLMRISDKYFFGQISKDRKNWKTVKSDEIKSFENNTKIGLFVTDINNDSLTTAVFDSVFIDGVLVSIEKDRDDVHFPQKFSINNYPNPFNPSTKIKYTLPTIGKVSIMIYDILGRKVKELLNEDRNVGDYTEEWDATNSSNIRVTSGVYFYRVTFNGNVKTSKMLLLK